MLKALTNIGPELWEVGVIDSLLAKGVAPGYALALTEDEAHTLLKLIYEEEREWRLDESGVIRPANIVALDLLQVAGVNQVGEDVVAGVINGTDFRDPEIGQSLIDGKTVGDMFDAVHQIHEEVSTTQVADAFNNIVVAEDIENTWTRNAVNLALERFGVDLALAHDPRLKSLIERGDAFTFVENAGEDLPVVVDALVS